MTRMGKASEGTAKAFGAMSVTGTKGRLRRSDAPRTGIAAKADLHHAWATVKYGFVARKLACPRTMGGYHSVLF